MGLRRFIRDCHTPLAPLAVHWTQFALDLGCLPRYAISERFMYEMLPDAPSHRGHRWQILGQDLVEIPAPLERFYRVRFFWVASPLTRPLVWLWWRLDWLDWHVGIPALRWALDRGIICLPEGMDFRYRDLVHYLPGGRLYKEAKRR